MEEDIQNYSPTVMFRGTPCMSTKFLTIKTEDLILLHNFNSISFQKTL